MGGKLAYKNEGVKEDPRSVIYSIEKRRFCINKNNNGFNRKMPMSEHLFFYKGNNEVDKKELIQKFEKAVVICVKRETQPKKVKEKEKKEVKIYRIEKIEVNKKKISLGFVKKVLTVEDEGIKKKVKTAYNNKCFVCGRELPLDRLTVHHVIHRVFGGPTCYSNLLPLCGKCHSGYHIYFDHRVLDKFLDFVLDKIGNRIKINELRRKPISYVYPVLKRLFRHNRFENNTGRFFWKIFWKYTRLVRKYGRVNVELFSRTGDETFLEMKEL